MKSFNKAQLPSAVFPYNNSPGDLISSSVEITSDPNRGLPLIFQQWPASFPNTSFHFYLNSLPQFILIRIKHFIFLSNQTLYVLIKNSNK